MFNNAQFIEAMNAPIKEIDSTVVIDGITYNSDKLISVNPYYEGGLLCSVMRCCAIEIQFDDSDNMSNEAATAFKGKTVSSVQIGVKQQSNAAFAYKQFGAYTVYSAEYRESTDSVYLVCYDNMLAAMKPYNISEYTASRTVLELLTDICTALGWTLTDLSSTAFANKAFSISADALNSYLPVVDEESGTEAIKSAYTFRDVLDDIAELVAGNLIFNNAGELCIVYPNEAKHSGETVRISADMQREITFEKQFGPINKVILVDNEAGNALPASNSSSITADGECQIAIVDNNLANSNRAGCITAIFSYLEGLYYTPFTATSFGVGYLDFGDEFLLDDKRGNSHNAIMLSDNFLASLTVQEVFSAKAYVANSETEYSVAGPFEKVKVDLKQLISKSTEMSERLAAAQEVISNATSGHAVLVDLEYDSVNKRWCDGGGEADTLVLSQYPAVADTPGGNDWNTGRVIRINNDGMGVSTQGIGGPYSDFAVYYDETLGKYCVNADDISVGTLQGIRAELDEGVIGGFTLGAWVDYIGVQHEGMKKTFNFGTTENPTYYTFAIDAASGSSSAKYFLQVFYSDEDGNALAGEYSFAVGLTSNGCTLEAQTVSAENGYFSDDVEIIGDLNMTLGKVKQANTVLWSGAYYMNASQTITLAEKVSEQTSGIVLIFSAYANRTAQNDHWQSFFVPKYLVSAYSNGSSNFPLCTADFSYIGCKYLYIQDKTIGGNANNDTGVTTTNGIKHTNNHWVLRYVIGV